MTVEVFVRQPPPAGLADALLTALTTEENAPESSMAGIRELTNVLVHEPRTWATSGDGARYLVRVTVPGSWTSPDLGAYLIPRITAAIAATEPDPARLYREPHCPVQLVGLKEHALGTLGRVTTATDLTRLMTAGYRAVPDERVAAPGTAIDPVCGMTVDLATATITLDHDGTRYAFCAPVCRKVFAEDLA